MILSMPVFIYADTLVGKAGLQLMDCHFNTFKLGASYFSLQIIVRAVLVNLMQGINQTRVIVLLFVSGFCLLVYRTLCQ